MYFTNTTIVSNGNTIITGMNASGKSTIVDAIQLALIADKRKVKFNSAADSEGKRDVKSYVRGEINTEEISCLRPGDVVSHIVLEFLSDNGPVIMGVVIELNNGIDEMHFYKANNVRVSDQFYLDDENKPNDFAKLKSAYEKYYVEFEYLSAVDYRRALASQMGVEEKYYDKYISLLIASIGFKSVSKVDDFINNFLFLEDNIDVSELRENNAKLISLKASLEENNLKATKCQEIIDLCTKYSEIDIKNNKNELLKKKYQLEKNRSNLEKQKREKIKVNSLYNKNVSDIELYKKEKQNLEDQKEAAQCDLEDSDNNRQIKEAKRQLQETENELNKSKLILSSVASQIKNVYDTGKQLNDLLEGNNNTFEKILIKIADNLNTPEKIPPYLKDFGECIDSIKEEYIQKKFADSQKLIEINKSIKETNLNIKKLRSNQKVFRSDFSQLIKYLKEQLFDKFGKDIVVKPLCDYGQILDEEWRNAIEGYLNTQRLALIIEPDYVLDAVKLYKYYYTNIDSNISYEIVDTTKLNMDYQIDEQTLASKVRFSNKYASAYAQFILGKVYCVDDEEQLNKYEVSITKDCIRYKNFTYAAIKQNVYKNPLIGNGAIEVQLKKEIENLQLLENQRIPIDESLNKDVKIIELCHQTDAKSIDIERLNQFETVKTYQQKIKNLTSKINRLEQVPSFGRPFELSQIIDNLKSEIARLDEKINKANYDKGSNENILSNIDKSIENYRADDTKLKNEYNELFSKTSNVSPNDEIWSEEEILNYENNQDVINRKINENKNNLYKLHNSIVKKKTEYNQKYFFNADCSSDTADEYRIELNKKIALEGNELSASVQTLHKKNITIFKKEFMSKLKWKFDDMDDIVESLNFNLRSNPFDKDRYSISVTKTDDPELNALYDIINSDDTYETGLFETEESSKNRLFLDNFFERMATLDSKDEIERLQDYRKYRKFDVMIQSNYEENGVLKHKTRYLSQVKKQQSGGENQVPFYILAAASFQNLISRKRKENDSVSIVLFDEVFNTMDANRIESMLGFFKKLNVQIFMALTAEKVPNMCKYMDTTNVIFRDGNNAFVEEFTNEK